jgi:hypothetical protein
MLLTLPFIASSIVMIFYAFNFGEFNVLHEELKASLNLNGQADWDNSIHIIGPNNEVNSH